ncbi:MAG: HD-GYP domain-containing protein [Candidatus Aminicenantaceae bacterium]
MDKDTKKSHLPKELAFSKNIEEIIVRFSAALKISQLYDSNNITYLRQTSLLFKLLNEIINSEGEAVIRQHEGTFYFNSVRIKFVFFNYHNLRFLSEELKKRGIGTIIFKNDLSEKELKRFINLLSKVKIDKDDPFYFAKLELDKENIKHVSIEEVHPFGIFAIKEKDQLRKYAKQVFFKSITHLDEIFEKEKQNKVIRLKTTRRLMQSLIDLTIEDETFLIGLINIKNFNEYELNHSVNVCILSICLGRRLGLDKNELLELALCAFFHDIGKLDIPKEILGKKTQLTYEERKMIEKHSIYGAEKLIHMSEESSIPVRALHVAFEHHIWNDFNGYPQLWKKDSINLYSKIVKVCDFFDAITTYRTYRTEAFTKSNTLNLLYEKRNSEFDPLLVKIFIEMIGIYPIGDVVILDSGEIGIVIEVFHEKEFSTRPRVKIISDNEGNKIDGAIVDLREKDPQTNNFKQSIHKSLNPKIYGINVTDYFLTEDNEKVNNEMTHIY